MTKLSDLTIDEVSLVRKGANQHARVAIAKSADEPGGTVELFDDQGNPLDSEALEHGDVVYDETGQAYQYDETAEDEHEGEYSADELEDEYESVGKAATLMVGNRAIKMGSRSTRAAFGAKRGMQTARRGAERTANTARVVGSDMRTGASTLRNRASQSAVGQGLAAGSTFAAQRTGAAAGQIASRGRSTASAVQGFAQNPATRNLAIAGGSGGILGGAEGYHQGRKNSVNKSFSDELRVELSKALTDDDRDEVISKAFGAMEALQEQAEAAYNIAEQEREARRDAEFYEVAKSYQALPVETEVLAEVFKACADNLDPEYVEVIAKCFNFATNAIFDEQGAIGGGSNSDIMAQVDAFAQSRVSKSHGDPSQFVVDAFGSDPALYDQYLTESGH